MGILKSKGAALEEQSPKRKFHPPFRMSGMTALTIVLVIAIYFLAKQQIGLLAFKACLMTGAATLGYAIDRTLFPSSRPHCVDLDVRWRAEWRRAGIVAAALLTAGLGS